MSIAAIGILQDSDELRSQTHGMQVWDGKTLCERILSTLRLLFAWRFQFEEDYPNLSYTVAIEPSTVLAHLHVPEKYSASSIWSTHFQRAQELATYNAALLVTLQLVETWDITSRINEALTNYTVAEGPPASLQPLILPNAAIRPSHVLEEIHRSAGYFMHPSHSRSGLLAMFYPLLCWSVFAIAPQAAAAMKMDF